MYSTPAPKLGLKYLRKIVVTDDFDDQPGSPIQAGWAWYTGI